MWASVLAVLQRDLKLVSRQGGEWLNPLSFFVMVITLFPLAISSTPAKLAAMAGGVVWIAALLSVLLSMDSLFRQDYDDGSLEQLLVSPAPLPLVVLAKVLAHWLQTGACLTLLTPVAALLLHLPNSAMWTGTDHVKPARRSKLSTNPIVCRKGRLNKPLIVRQN